MRWNLLLPAAGLLASLAFPTIASAATAYSNADVNMRAGPGTGYPVIVTIYAGEPVTIYGCLSGWSWCDTEWDGARGWVRGDYLDVVYESRYVYLPEYAPRVGLTFITFEFNNYWDDHYRHRHFYRDRERWRDYWRLHRDVRADFRDRRERDRDRDRLVIRENREDRVDVRRDRDRARIETRRDRNRDRLVTGDDRRERARDQRDRRDRIVTDGTERRDSVRQDRRERRDTVRQDRRERRDNVRQDRRERRDVVRQDRKKNRQVVKQDRRRDVKRDARRDRVVRKGQKGKGKVERCAQPGRCR
jgi:uncharacterized protein YraI